MHSEVQAALLLVRVTKQASQVGGLAKKKNSFFVCDLPSEWDTSAVNLTNDLLSKCQSCIKQQRIFDRKSLGVGVCYNCGHVLGSTVDGAHTFLVDQPSNMTRGRCSSLYIPSSCS